ncbi:MAG: nitrilase-related carbon-nitrogen hydrolase, partial [Terriglobia bacterium]
MERFPKFTLAVVQMSPGPDASANLACAVSRIEEASRQGAKVICLPELFRTPYFCQREDA